MKRFFTFSGNAIRVAFLSLLFLFGSRTLLHAQDGFFGEIRMFAGNFAPRGWAFCDGSLLSIAQNQALFSLLGTTYGGDGRTTFALPDLRGRVPVSPGQGPGLSNYPLGQQGGTETTTLTTANLPAHNHGFNVLNAAATQASAAGAALALPLTANLLPVLYAYGAAPPTTATHPATIGYTGSNLPINNVQPYLSINFIICVAGTFPSRN